MAGKEKTKTMSKTSDVSNSKTADEDLLAGLFQLDIDENYALEEKALIMMVKMLDNLEDFKELSSTLKTIVEKDEMMETRLLSLFKVLINGIQLEYKQLGYMPWYCTHEGLPARSSVEILFRNRYVFFPNESTN